MKPKNWCYPATAFGKITEHNKPDRIEVRSWRPPHLSEETAPKLWADFRGAVIQNAYSVHLRAAKNTEGSGVSRDTLGSRDKRPDAFMKWTARLNGNAWWNLDDTAVIMREFPGALPEWDEVQVFLDVATGVRPPPPGWGSYLRDASGMPLLHPDIAGPPQRIEVAKSSLAKGSGGGSVSKAE